MASTSETNGGRVTISAARQQAERHYATLEKSVGWLLGTLQLDAATAPEAESLADRLRHAAETGTENERLLAFAARFCELEGGGSEVPAEISDERLNDLAVRYEEASCEALALFVAQQAENAARAAGLAQLLPDEKDEDGRRQYLAGVGASVRKRLDTDEGAAKLPAEDLELYIVRRFLTPAECEALINIIDRDLYPSGILAEHPDPEFRTSKSCNLPLGEPIVDSVDRRIADLLGIDRRFSETVQGQRYEVGQQFKPHHDFFHKGESYYDHVERGGGQRSWTAMLFLNEPEAGGCTNFPQAGCKVAPEAGALLVWNNMDREGRPNHSSLHQGMPVEAGMKYVITKWFRERPWR